MLVIKKVLNSSVVLAQDKKNKDIIALGKGIGFGKKAGQQLNRQEIDKMFLPADAPQFSNFATLLAEVSPELVEVVQLIIAYAEEKIADELNKNLMYFLIDHLKFALERLKENIQIQNKLYWEVQNYYPKEFDVGCYALKVIEEQLNETFPKEEAANIAFHIINAQKNTTQEYDSMRVTKLLNELMTIIRLQVGTKLDSQSISYQRLVTHLKFFVERLLSQRQLESTDMIMQEHILNTYTKAASIAIKLVEFIDINYHYKVSGEELTYLIVHINRNI
ncbi:PRD domain-containing protein [Ligilactobacillus sp. Marseille-Q7487]|uniref:PRD domain-containing protein n=1 Tax=Ligilactobacillus sp. Marseille-Q7487 TaxID=3022128 RepID=UPI0024A97F11|nr:PRD domain-containing protein [Ligilactobacillus sp. Marseille-Q7487]